MIQDISSSDFDQKVLKSSIPVLVDFWAVWCAPCKLAEPVLEDLSKLYENKVTFFKLDVDKYSDLAQKYDVMSIPTTILFKNGNEVGRQIGFAGKEGFEELLKKS